MIITLVALMRVIFILFERYQNCNVDSIHISPLGFEFIAFIETTPIVQIGLSQVTVSIQSGHGPSCGSLLI